MSKLYRSDELGERKVEQADLRRPIESPGPTRPPAGFYGCTPGQPAAPPVTAMEQREHEAARTLDEARRQAEAIQRDAYHAGFEQGQRAGEKLAAQSIEPTLQAFRTLLESIGEDRARLIEEHRQELIKIAFALACAVLHRALELAPEAVADVVEAALVKAGRSREVTLQLSPHDRQLVDQQMKRRHGDAWPAAALTIEEDESVGRGGCRLLTETGDIDATIETQLRVLKTMLWEH